MKPSSTWRDPSAQFDAAIQDSWFKTVASLYREIFLASVEFFIQLDFIPALVPITTEAISSPMGKGSDSEPVLVELFGKPVYLADSMQFLLEYYLRQGWKGSFYIMPSFRGEDSDSRHLNQFFHVEAEIQGDLESVMGTVERLIKTICVRILKNSSHIFDEKEQLEHVAAVARDDFHFACISHDEAIARVKKSADCVKEVLPGIFTLTSFGEKALLDEQRGQPLWITKPPKLLAPFYQARDQVGEKALAADLLIGIGETVGCGQRHSHSKQVSSALEEHGVEEGAYAWYLRMKRDYPLQTAGFGMGVERLILWVLRHNDIRDVHLVPRLKGFATSM